MHTAKERKGAGAENMPGGLLIERKTSERRESLLNSRVFRIADAVKKVLNEDRQQKQPLILSLNEQVLIKLIKGIVIDKNRHCLIGIAGESASGKTTFVKYASKALRRNFSGETYTSLCCDDYYKDTSLKLKELGGFEALLETGFSFDTPDAVNLELMRAHLISLKNGCGINSPEYDFVTCESIPDRNHKNPAKAVLAEGLYVLGDELADLFDIKVYVFTPFEKIKERWFNRAASRGKTGRAAELQFDDVNRAAKIYVRPAAENADVIINGLTSAEYIEELAEKIVSAASGAITSGNTI